MPNGSSLSLFVEEVLQRDDPYSIVKERGRVGKIKGFQISDDKFFRGLKLLHPKQHSNRVPVLPSFQLNSSSPTTGSVGKGPGIIPGAFLFSLPQASSKFGILAGYSAILLTLDNPPHSVKIPSEIRSPVILARAEVWPWG
jgi:hypothetical protein